MSNAKGLSVTNKTGLLVLDNRYHSKPFVSIIAPQVVSSRGEMTK